MFCCAPGSPILKILPEKDPGVLKLIRTICVNSSFILFIYLSFTISIRAYLYLLNDSMILIIITIIMKISLGVEAGLR